MPGRVFKPAHAEPGSFNLNYILLPYGEFYQKTRVFLEAKRGDILRFFNGPDYTIDSVVLISEPKLCDVLCRMRYDISWAVAYDKWLSYARLEGHGKDILCYDKCICIFYGTEVEAE